MAFDPISTATGIAGLGLSIYGGLEAAGYAKQEAQISKQEVGVELQQEGVRRQAMEMSAQRQMLQQVRNNQLARSQALTTASGQGAQFSSGLQGAYGNVSGTTSTNILGISQGLQFGESMFNLNAQLDALKMQQADLQGKQASAMGIAGIGSGLTGLAGIFSKQS